MAGGVKVIEGSDEFKYTPILADREEQKHFFWNKISIPYIAREIRKSS
jgi:hypothetical protein